MTIQKAGDKLCFIYIRLHFSHRPQKCTFNCTGYNTFYSDFILILVLESYRYTLDSQTFKILVAVVVTVVVVIVAVVVVIVVIVVVVVQLAESVIRLHSYTVNIHFLVLIPRPT